MNKMKSISMNPGGMYFQSIFNLVQKVDPFDISNLVSKEERERETEKAIIDQTAWEIF